MRKCLAVLLGVAFLAAVVGCESNKTRIAEGTAVGGGLGALAGGIIGHQSHSGVEGALIGGAVGAAAGALVGSQIEKKPAQAEALAAAPMTMQQIVDLSKQGTSSDDIISKIKSTNSKFVLTAEDIDYLHKQGVSERVIEAMQGK